MKIPFRGDSVPDAKAFQVHSAIERRIRNDLGTVRSAAGSSGELAAELNAIELELADLREESNQLHARWQTEKEAIAELRSIKEQIEQTRLEIEQAERRISFGLMKTPDEAQVGMPTLR